MKHLSVLIACATLVSCSKETARSFDDRGAVENAASLAAATLPDGATILAKCGESQGHSDLQNPDGSLSRGEDAMTEGFVALVERADHSLDVLSKDATKNFVSILGMGGNVSEIYNENGDRSIVATLPGGVVQTYQFVKSRRPISPDLATARLFWTQSKPGNGIAYPGSQSFVAECY